ncbi:DUF3857 domain-containing protein [candidate division WOR-3 bacterium]|nr:DUF3857 domain-containing protein [candidate division WOR-3 bacterium]
MSWVLSLLIILGIQDVEGFINQAPTKSDYPKAGAVVLLDRKILEVHNDLSSSTSRELLIKIFNDRGKGEYGDLKERYNNLAQDFQVITAQTHTPDGRKVKVGEKAITDLSAPEVMQASAYTNVRMKVVSFSALEPNAIIEYQYKIVPKNKSESFLSKIFKKKEPNHFFGEVVFGTREPILKKEFKLIVPKGVEFKYKLVNGETEPHIEHFEDKVIYTWIFENLESIIGEPNCPPIPELAPRLIFSSFSSWDELAKWLSDKFYKSIEVSKKIKELVGSFADTPEEKIRDSFLYVTTEIRNIRLPVGLVGYVPTSANQVYANKYGDPRDKVVLLCSFLKAGGIEAFPVFVNRTGIKVIKDIASPSQFNHIILAVSGEGDSPRSGYFLLDPQATNSKFGYLPEEEQGVEGFAVFEGGWTFKSTLIMPREVSLSKSTLKLSISGSGDLSGETSTELGGFYDRRARRVIKDKTKKEEQMWVEGRISGIATNTKLSNYSFSDLKDLTEPIRLDASFDASEFGSVSDNTIQFFIPRNPFDFVNPSQYVGLSTRKHLLLLHSTRIIRYEVELEIPEGFTADYLPENLTNENDFASVNITVDTLNRKINYTSELIFKEAKIKPDEYTDFKSVVADFLKRKTRMIILKKI